MKLKLTRRRFGKLAIASTATATISNYLVNKTFAQTPLVVHGAVPEPLQGRVVVQSLNLTTGIIQNVTTASLEPGEQLTGFTSLADGTLVLSISPVLGGKKEDIATRLVFLGSSPKILTVSGLTKQQLLASVVGTNDGGLSGLVIKKNFSPPVRLVDIDLRTGSISLTEKVKLPLSQRFNNLTQSPVDGKIYTTSVEQQGNTNLEQLDLVQKLPIKVAQLRFNNRIWNSGLSSLACSSANQIFALGAGRYDPSYNLYTVNLSDGVMTLVKEKWGVTQITILRD